MQIVRYKNHSKKNLTAKLLKIYPSQEVNPKTVRLYHSNISRSKGPIIILDTLPNSPQIPIAASGAASASGEGGEAAGPRMTAEGTLTGRQIGTPTNGRREDIR